MSKKEVFKISYGSEYFITENKDNVPQLMNEVTEHLAVGETVVLTKELMTQDELNELPDFDGF